MTFSKLWLQLGKTPRKLEFHLDSYFIYKDPIAPSFFGCLHKVPADGNQTTHNRMMVNEGAIEICVAEGGEGKWKKLKENSRKINLSEFPLTSQKGPSYLIFCVSVEEEKSRDAEWAHLKSHQWQTVSPV